MKIKLSTLWIVVLFNITFRDFHEFLRSGYLEELLAMTTNGAEVSQGLLLASAIVLQIPIDDFSDSGSKYQGEPMDKHHWGNHHDSRDDCRQFNTRSG